MAAKGVHSLSRSQHSVVGVHAHTAVLTVAAKAFREIEGGVVGNRRSLYLTGESPLLKQPLNARELSYRERTLQGIVAACVEEDDDGGPPPEELLESDRVARMILEND